MMLFKLVANTSIYFYYSSIDSNAEAAQNIHSNLVEVLCDIQSQLLCMSHNLYVCYALYSVPYLLS